MAIGYKTPGSGRKKGSINLRTSAMHRYVQEIASQIKVDAEGEYFIGDGVDFLQSIYKNLDFPVQIRMDAARAAAPFERAKPAAVVHVIEPEPVGIQHFHKELPLISDAQLVDVTPKVDSKGTPIKDAAD